jgi:hypothetical protein
MATYSLSGAGFTKDVHIVSAIGHVVLSLELNCR